MTARQGRRLGSITRHRTGLCLWLVAATWFAWSLVQESIQAANYVRWSRSLWVAVPFSVVVTFIGSGLPALCGLSLYAEYTEDQSGRARRARHRKLITALQGHTGILLLLTIVLMPCYLLVESYFPFAVSPLVTPLCAVLTVLAGYLIIRRVHASKLLALGLVFVWVLATKYADWNSRKPFVRDMLRIAPGMEITEVETIMAAYGSGQPLVEQGGRPTDSELESLVYMPMQSADMATVRLNDGRVESVVFSRD